MLIDTHIHEDKYSFDSFLPFEDAVKKAKEVGLDAICITNHESNQLRKDIGDSAVIDDILVIVGAEFLTDEGDIVIFGLNDLPKEKVSARELLTMVKKAGGVAVPAHPFRTNNRGLGNNMIELSGLLSGVESFNGSTTHHHNLQAFALATELELPSLGASDAHRVDRVGKYATKFYGNIRDHRDFIEAVKSKDFHPVEKTETGYRNLDYAYEEVLRLARAKEKLIEKISV